MSNRTTQVRIFGDDVDYINTVALKVSARLLRKVTAAEVLNAVIRSISGNGNKTIDDVSDEIANHIR